MQSADAIRGDGDTPGGRLMDADNKYKMKREVRITPEMFYSEPFKALSASALRTLMRCLQKRAWTKQRVHGKKKTVYIDGEFIFPYGEAESLGIRTTQFWKNIGLLIRLGFIDLAYQGGRYQRDQHERDCSRYRLSDRWKKYGTDDFVPSEKAKVLAPDFYIRKNLERGKAKSTS